jgi:hypothetical protein
MGAINTILLLWCIYRLHMIGNQPNPPIRVSAPSNATELGKPVEGFNPKKPDTVLPRSEEERNARVKTVREVDQNVFEFDSKL